MIPKGLFTQIGMIIIAIAIVITYVKPEFETIQGIQTDIKLYEAQRGKVLILNNLLAEKMLQIENEISGDDKERLFKYMPTTVDDIAVLRDLYLITLESGLVYLDTKYIDTTNSNARGSRNQNTGTNVSNSENDPIPHTLSLSVEGTYSQLKKLLDLLEQNHYPLEVRNMIITKTEDEFLKADLEINTYSFRRIFEVEE